jgi:hypothetical protein
MAGEAIGGVDTGQNLARFCPGRLRLRLCAPGRVACVKTTQPRWFLRDIGFAARSQAGCVTCSCSDAARTLRNSATAMK